MKRYLAEFIGTFFLVLVVVTSLAADVSTLTLAVGAGSILAAMVYMGRRVSGAHYNPAVSLAFIMRGSLSLSQGWRYMAAQLLGAVAAGLISWLIQGETAAPGPGIGIAVHQSFITELLFTFALALVYLKTVADKSELSGLAVGFTFLAGVLVSIEISGGVFNPALGLGPILVDALAGPGGFGGAVLYILGPLAGGALAAVVDRRFSD